MALILVATQSGIRALNGNEEGKTELIDHMVSALSCEPDGRCLAVVDEREIWRRDASGCWNRVASTSISLQSIASTNGLVFVGEMDEAVVLRVPATGKVERLAGFDKAAGREEWFAGGPPLGVRSLATTAEALRFLLRCMSAVFLAHPTTGKAGRDPFRDVRRPRGTCTSDLAAAAGLCVSQDAGLTWKVFSAGIEGTSSLALAVLQDEVLFSVQDGPFAERSQLWRRRMDTSYIEQVRNGLPEWLHG